MSEIQLEITKDRRVFTNKESDYTCVELFESDGIYDYFQIDPNLFKYGSKYLVNNDIFILQYPLGNDLSFSCGKILSIENNNITHSSSTEGGSSGSPIIKRCWDNYIVGLHSSGIKNIKDDYEYNIATTFISIFDNINKQLKEQIKEDLKEEVEPLKEQLNEFICIYKLNKKEKEINLLHDYNLDSSGWNRETRKLYGCIYW